MKSAVVESKWSVRRIVCGAALVGIAALLVVPLGSQNLSENDVARRQFENGRGHMQRAGYDEGLKDFRAVAESYPDSTLADNALLEIARYYADIADDPEQASTYADEIIRKYPTSDSAPEALIVQGDVVMTRSRRRADLSSAVAAFDRVSGIYPDADSVPRAQYLAAEAMRLSLEPAVALQRYRQIVARFPNDPILPKVHIGAGTALVASGDPFGAIEEFQLARSRDDDSEDARAALGRLTTLYRLFVKPAQMAPYGNMVDDGLVKLRATDVQSLLATPRGALLFTNKIAVLTSTESTRELIPTGVLKPRAVSQDRMGRVAVIDAGTLKRKGIPPLTLAVPQGNASRLLEDAVAAVNLRNGEWLVTSDDDRGIERFSSAGKFIAVASPGRFARLALDEFDRLAALDQDGKTVKLYDETAKLIGSISQKGAGYELRNPVDLAFDSFGHLYVLERNAVFVFAPFQKPVALIRTYTEPEKSPGAFPRATALAIDETGRLFIADERAERIRVYN